MPHHTVIGQQPRHRDLACGLALIIAIVLALAGCRSDPLIGSTSHGAIITEGSSNRPAQALTNAPFVATAELRSDYTPTITEDRTVYRPLLSHVQFLVVAARVPLTPGTAPADATDPSPVSSYKTRLLGPEAGRERKPVFGKHRLSDSEVELEQVFAIPRGETGHYGLWADGRTYPIRVQAAAPPAVETETVPAIAPPKARRPLREAAVAAATKAVSDNAPDTPTDGAELYRLCAQVQRFELCDGRPCRTDGLLSKTVLNCRAQDCPPGEVQSSLDPETRSLAGCIAACRQAQLDEIRDAAQGTAQVRCMQ